MGSKYAFGKLVAMSYDQALERVTQELAKEGFGVLTEIDVAATLKKKLGVGSGGGARARRAAGDRHDRGGGQVAPFAGTAGALSACHGPHTPDMECTSESALEIHRRFDPPYGHFDDSMLGPEFARELDVVSRLWFRCGYRPGIGVTLNFLLLGQFIALHQEKYPSRFPSLRAMMDAFHRIDVFVRAVTDSGARPSGGISSPRVRSVLKGIRQRHSKAGIPEWMLTYFGFNVLEMVERQCPLGAEEKRLHLAYIGKVFRIMGVPFTQNRAELERFARDVEERHAAVVADAPKLLSYVLCVAEMAGVSSGPESILCMLPPRIRAVFEPLYPRVRPSLPRRLAYRLLGRLLLPRAVGAPRAAVPASLPDLRPHGLTAGKAAAP